MQRAVDLSLLPWRNTSGTSDVHRRATMFVVAVVCCGSLSALLATSLPLQVSIVTVFLFAGPHNWFELRYFLQRMPVRFGRSRAFFFTAFSGIAVLTLAYASLPLLYNVNIWPGGDWSMPIAIWNTLLLLWLAVLVLIRGKQKPRSDWSWAIPVAFLLIALNWLAPELFSLAIVYIHPLIALWFLDRHLRRTRPEWLPAYRRCLAFLPLCIIAVCWRLSNAPQLADDNGLFWRITQHAGAELLPNVSGHLLVSVHLFLEMLHYAVWIVALPLIASRGPFWVVTSVPLARHPRGFPRTVTAVLLFGVFLAGLLWFGFSVDYATTRDVYFTVAIAHVLAEAPFLLKSL